MADIIRDLPLAVFLVMVGFALAMAGVLVFAGLRARHAAAITKSTPTSPIGMAQDGYRELAGVVEPIGGETLTSPLTDSSCCWYHAHVEELVSTRGHRTLTWRTVREVTSTAPFFVRDATGVCAVHPGVADVTPRDRSVWVGATLEPTDRNPDRHPLTDLPALQVEVAGGPDRRFRYTEERIYPGDPMLVHGVFESGRLEAAFDDEEGDETDTDGPATGTGSEDEPTSARWDTDRQADRLAVLARNTTKARVARGDGRKHPFVIAATEAGQHEYLNEVGSSAAFNVALVPLSIAALLLWIRFGN
jgi:hypothetical protein